MSSFIRDPDKPFEPDMDWLTDDLAVGGEVDPGYAVHVAQEIVVSGIGCVIDCRIEEHAFELWAQFPEVVYQWLPIDDDGRAIPSSHFDAAVEAARFADGLGLKTLVHCAAGMNRGPSTALAILLDRGWQPGAAYDLIVERRPFAHVAYAIDAYRAHLLRETGAVERDAVEEFSRHINARDTARDFGVRKLS